jgi:hypothetical protein
MSIEKEFIPYTEALALKELGFDEPCLGYWNIDPYLPKPTFNLVKPFDHEWCVPAPLYQQCWRWFREKYGHYYEIFVDDDKTFGFLISYFVEAGRGDKPIQRKYVTHEEAELECLKKLIQLAK